MTKFQKISMFVLRLGLGFLMFYAGISKVLTPDWSAVGYLGNAQTFTGFYEWFTQPSILPVIDFMNQWGLLLLGVSLILGAFVTLSSSLGILLMVLYYFPTMDFPYVNTHYFLVDYHIVYILILVMFIAFKVGRIWGLDVLLPKSK